MSKGTHKSNFLESLDRCCENENFIPSFYKRFLATSDEVRMMFANTDFEKQNRMLVRSLQLAAGATTGDPESLRELRAQTEHHDRHHLNVRPEMYHWWLNSVLATAAEYDPMWDDQVEEAWQTILGFVTRHMARYY